MIRVLTVDDHAVVRSGIVGLLDSEVGIRSVGAVGGFGEALAAFEALHPDVVIADFRMEDGDGLELCRRLERAAWPSRVLVFSGFASADLSVAAMIAGAGGMLGKGTAGELLLAAVRAVAAGGMPSPELSAAAIKRAAEKLDAEDLPIFSMRIDGSSAAEIADVMRTDRATVERRIDGIVDALKPRVELPALSVAGGERRTVGRWL